MKTHQNYFLYLALDRYLLVYLDFLLSHLIAWEGCTEMQFKKFWILAERKGIEQKLKNF